MRDNGRIWTGGDYAMAAAVMSLMGGYYWAIRGTSGYGGETGGMLAGLGWALLWHAFSRMGEGADRRPYSGLGMVAAITFGIALGGATGYGVYIAWLQEKFYLVYPNDPRPIAAWTGYAMLFLCGFHWGGNAGCFMAWCAPSKPLRAHTWKKRIACGVGGAVTASVFVRLFPQLFLPFYSEGIYVHENETAWRALGSIRTIAPHVGLTLGFLACEVVRGDWRAVKLILTMAVGFALPFSIGGIWQTMQDVSADISWWKNWEMTIGLGGGCAFGLAFYLFNRPGPAARPPLGPKAAATFCSGFLLWFPSLTCLVGAYDGWCSIHSVETSVLGYLGLLLVSLVPVAAAWILRRRSGAVAPQAISFQTAVALQLLIVVCGVLVTIPVEWQPANQILAVLYTVYLAGSLALVLVLRKRFSA